MVYYHKPLGQTAPPTIYYPNMPNFTMLQDYHVDNSLIGGLIKADIFMLHLLPFYRKEGVPLDVKRKNRVMKRPPSSN
ncbi:hypothetical protein SAMN06295926_104302 [Lysinibacillus sp. AC-3]|nr:hypothetical protein SAMN06295926_104302 [Lysinibacillus sp. AC-3]